MFDKYNIKNWKFIENKLYIKAIQQAAILIFLCHLIYASSAIWEPYARFKSAAVVKLRKEAFFSLAEIST